MFNFIQPKFNIGDSVQIKRRGAMNLKGSDVGTIQSIDYSIYNLGSKKDERLSIQYHIDTARNQHDRFFEDQLIKLSDGQKINKNRFQVQEGDIIKYEGGTWLVTKTELIVYEDMGNNMGDRGEIIRDWKVTIENDNIVKTFIQEPDESIEIVGHKNKVVSFV